MELKHVICQQCGAEIKLPTPENCPECNCDLGIRGGLCVAEVFNEGEQTAVLKSLLFNRALSDEEIVELESYRCFGEDNPGWIIIK